MLFDHDFFYRRLNSFFCLALITFLSFCVGAYVIFKFEQIKKISEPLPDYFRLERSLLE